MEFQFGKNPEFTINLFNDLTFWALPVSIEWSSYYAVVRAKSYFITLKILCFSFNLEIWKWKK